MFLLILTGLGSLASYNSSFQTLLVRKYFSSLAKKLETKITVNTIDVSLFNKLIITNLYIEDTRKDTLFYTEKLEVDIDEFSYLDKKIILDEVVLTNSFFNLKKYKNEKTTNLNFIVSYFNSTDTTSKSEWIFALNEVKLIKNRFNYNDANVEKLKEGIDYKHISLTNLDLSITKIDLINKGVDCEITKLNFLEQSGFQIDKFTSEVNVTPSGIITQYLKISTPNSTIDGNVTFLTDDYSKLATFIEDVNIKSYFNPTQVDFKDISYFAPTLIGLNKSLNFEGELKGKINNLKGRKLVLLFDDGTRFKGNIDISGLPNPEDMFMYVNVKELITSKSKIETIPVYPFLAGKFIKLPTNFSHLGTIRFKGNFTGFYHDFVAYGKIKTRLGNISTDVSVNFNNDMPFYEGNVQTNHFNLGKLFGTEKDLGDITMNIDIQGKGFSKQDVNAKLTGTIEQVVIKEYEYNNVDVKGSFNKQMFNGFLAVKDENISFDFDGSIDLGSTVPKIKFTSTIENAKLAKLNLVQSKKKLKTRFSTQLIVNLSGATVDELVGDVQLVNSRYNDKLDSIKVKSMLITSKINNKHKTISVASDLLDAKLEGNFLFNEMAHFINHFLIRYIPSQIDHEHKIANLSNNIDFNIEIHKSELLSKVLLDGVKLSDHTKIKGSYNANNHELSLNGNAPFIDAYGIKVKRLDFKGVAKENTFDFMVNTHKIYQNDSIYIDNFKIVSQIANDSMLTNIKWKNKKEGNKNEADISIATFFKGFDFSSSKLSNSYAYIEDTLWRAKPNNEIRSDTSSLFIKGFTVYSKTQRILIDGKLSDNPRDQLDILLKNFNLLTVEKIIPKNVIALEGVIDGVASIKQQNDDYIFTSDLAFNKFRINGNFIGKGNLKSLWNSTKQSLKLDGKFYDGYQPTILFGGYYYPNKNNERLDLTLELNRAKLSMFDAYTKDFLSELKGTVSANVSLTGSFQKPKLNGKLSLHNAKFKVIYLNTSFSTKSCQINIVPDMISFDNVEFLDKDNNVARVNATINHEWFTEWNLGLGLFIDEGDRFLALNTTEKDNSLYYGKVYVSGFVDITGDNEQMSIDVNVKTEKNTLLNIPLTDSEDLEENNFIEFISHDTTNLNLEIEEVDLSNIEMNFDLEITPEAEIRLIFDDQIGDVMRSRGSGDLKLQINNDGDMNMYGKYFIKDGDYLFTLQNVINKRFDLEEGGVISWNGSPYDAEINLTAVYRLRARLYDLLANIDTNDIYKKRIPVDLKLNMRNAMMNPDISFDIYLPTADEDTRSKVRSVLYVSDKEENIQELNKQVFSLLVLNTFLPPPGSNASYGRANVGSTTSSELLSNQLSNWLSKISNDFDIGVNYRPGDELSNQELELALSTQLFNDRLILDGNFGLSDRQNVSNQAQNTNNLIGDISLEYKITKDGKLRIKAFNNSNQFSLQNINSPYTQGVGLSYKEAYDTFEEFWGNLFKRFRKKTKNKK